MKLSNLVCYVALLVPRLIDAAEPTPIKTNQPASFEDAEAWNIQIEKQFQFLSNEDAPNIYGVPSFSHDFQRLLYCVTELRKHESFVVVRSLKTWDTIQRIQLPLGVEPGEGSRIVFSPDEKKAVLNTIVWTEAATVGTNLIFVDFDKQKAMGVRADVEQISALIWPDADHVYIGPETALNLDTLKVVRISAEQFDSAAKQLDRRISKHKNCFLELKSYVGLNAYNSPNLTITSRKNPAYARILLPVVSSGPEDWIIWTPDLRYVVFHAHMDFGGYAPPVFLRLGTTPTPELNFEVKGLEKLLTPEHRRKLQDALTDRKKVWMSVFEGRINPLNDKLVGPDDGKFRGYGYLTRAESNYLFRYALERFPARSHDVVSQLRADGDFNWENNVWGELIATTNSVGAETAVGERIEAQRTFSGTQQNGDQRTDARTELSHVDVKELFEKLTSEMPNSALFETQVIRCNRALDGVHNGLVKAIKDWNIQRNEQLSSRTVFVHAKTDGKTIRKEIVLLAGQISEAEVVVHFKLFQFDSKRAGKPYLPQFYKGSEAREIEKVNSSYLRQIKQALEYSASH